jgi:hypothetical protein
LTWLYFFWWLSTASAASSFMLTLHLSPIAYPSLSPTPTSLAGLDPAIMTALIGLGGPPI